MSSCCCWAATVADAAARAFAEPLVRRLPALFTRGLRMRAAGGDLCNASRSRFASLMAAAYSAASFELLAVAMSGDNAAVVGVVVVFVFDVVVVLLLLVVVVVVLFICAIVVVVVVCVGGFSASSSSGIFCGPSERRVADE